MVAQTPDGARSISRARPPADAVPTCVAVAAKDPRLCAAEPRTAPRATCEALVLRDDSEVRRADPADRPGVQARARAMAGRSSRRRSRDSPQLPAARGKLIVHGANRDTRPASAEADPAERLRPWQRRRDVARTRMRVELGTVGESESRSDRRLPTAERGRQRGSSSRAR